MAVSTPERKAAALAVATVLISAALMLGYAWLWPDGTDGGAPSYVGYSLTVAIPAIGFASFRLQRRFRPSAQRWYYRTLTSLLSLLIFVLWLWDKAV
jgi:ABC-type Co2+ transport system permease subunit